jgi:lipoate-protein ligase A
MGPQTSENENFTLSVYSSTPRTPHSTLRTPQQWRFLNTGYGEAAMNMALDEAMLLLHEAGETPPTLRVYGWQAPTLSLGYAQHSAKEVNLDACRRYGVTVVRRPTGGRAVLHDDEVTYSVVMPLTLADGSHTLTEHYRRIGLALAAALCQLGVPVRLARPQRPATTQRTPASPACFAALSRHELSVNGKKLVGSAQKRAQHALLQHGSIPLTLDRQRLFHCLHVSPEHRALLVEEAHTTMTAVHEVATAPVRIADLHEALRSGFATTFGVELIEGTVLCAEWRLAQQLRTTKYATATWNLNGAAAWRHELSGVPAISEVKEARS